MLETDYNEYYENRYLNQIGWYDKKAKRNKLYYQVFQWSVILFASVLPVLVSLLTEPYEWITIMLIEKR